MNTHPADIVGTGVLQLAAELAAGERPFAFGIVVDAQGSTAAQAGAKALFDADGALIAGWLGGGCAEATVAHAVVESLESGEPQLVDVDLDDEVLGAGMPCGGRMLVYVEPVLPHPTLWVLGHGRIAECLSHLGALMAFRVVVDDAMATPQRFPDAARVLTDDSGYAALAPAAADVVVVATQHRGDHESLSRLLAGPAGHIALIASRRRAGLVLEHLRRAGFDEADLARVHTPAGLAIGARTPEEIALSVMAEIVLLRRGAAGGSLSERPSRVGQGAAAPAMTARNALRAVAG